MNVLHAEFSFRFVKTHFWYLLMNSLNLWKLIQKIIGYVLLNYENLKPSMKNSNRKPCKSLLTLQRWGVLDIGASVKTNFCNITSGAAMSRF